MGDDVGTDVDVQMREDVEAERKERVGMETEEKAKGKKKLLADNFLKTHFVNCGGEEGEGVQGWLRRE